MDDQRGDGSAADAPPSTGDDELRLALSMRGGVSLAVWIGGAVQELDRLTRTDRPATNPADGVGGPDFYAALLWMAGYSRATLDVITGASAGGLNGVVLAASRAYGFDFARMLPLWIRLGDIELLSRDPGERHVDPRTGRRSRRPPSLLRGDEFFQDSLQRQLSALIAEAGSGPGSVTDPFDLILSATLVVPSIETTDEDAFSPLPEIRRDAEFHFRYLGSPGAPGSDFQQLRDVGQGATSNGPGSTVSLLALAGRATSSFPVAFEPARVSTHARNVFSDPPGPNEAPRLVLDGGVLDNIPVTKAIEAVAAAPVMGEPDRWLVFLHPSPGVRADVPREQPEANSPRAVGTLLITVSTAFSQESLLNDLDELNAHNTRVREQRSRRSALLPDVFGDDGTSGDMVDRNAIQILQSQASRSLLSARTMRATLDSLRAVSILEGDRHIRRPVIDRPATGHRRRVSETRYDEILAAHRGVQESSNVTSPDPPPGPDEVPPAWWGAVLPPPSLRLQCNVVSDWLTAVGRATQPGPGGRATLDGRITVARACIARLRRIIELAQNWHDQVWVVAAGTDVGDHPCWERQVRLATSTWQCVPQDLLAAVGEAYVLPPADRTGNGAMSDPLLTTADALDLAMRAKVKAQRVGVDSGCQDLGRWVFDRLCAVVADVAATGAEPAPGASRQVLTLHAGRENPALTLAALALVLARAITVETESDDDIRFLRISGSNETPLRRYFVDDGEPFGVDQKLCGNDLGNFAAFFSARWRANDWMWGRMDSVKSIVDLTIRPERLRGGDADGIVSLARVIAERAGIRDVDERVLREEVLAATEGSERNRDLQELRRLLTESMQRQIFDEMHTQIERLDDRPNLPKETAAAHGRCVAALSPDITAKMRTYRVGSETLRNLESKRRTSIGMRLAMVTYAALRPVPSRFLGRAIGAVMSLLKPLYLFASFGALNVARAVFVINLTAAGFWVGPWRYDFGPGDQPRDHQPWELLIGRIRWPQFHWHRFEWPDSFATALGFVVIASLTVLSAVLAGRHLRRRRHAVHRGQPKPKGLLWYLGSVAAGVGALIVDGFGDLRTGPLGVVIGAALIALLTCNWMRRPFWLPVFLGAAAIYLVVGLTYLLVAVAADDDVTTAWFADIAWMSVIALYGTMAWIAVLCTFWSVAPCSSTSRSAVE